MDTLQTKRTPFGYHIRALPESWQYIRDRLPRYRGVDRGLPVPWPLTQEQEEALGNYYDAQISARAYVDPVHCQLHAEQVAYTLGYRTEVIYLEAVGEYDFPTCARWVHEHAKYTTRPQDWISAGFDVSRFCMNHSTLIQPPLAEQILRDYPLNQFSLLLNAKDALEVRDRVQHEIRHHLWVAVEVLLPPAG